jgi:hypothetical protein
MTLSVSKRGSDPRRRGPGLVERLVGMGSAIGYTLIALAGVAFLAVAFTTWLSHRFSFS